MITSKENEGYDDLDMASMPMDSIKGIIFVSLLF